MAVSKVNYLLGQPPEKQRIWRESNPRHMVPETIALSAELQMPIFDMSFNAIYHTIYFSSCKAREKTFFTFLHYLFTA